MRVDAFIHFVSGSRRVNIRLGVLLLIPKSPQTFVIPVIKSSLLLYLLSCLFVPFVVFGCHYSHALNKKFVCGVDALIGSATTSGSFCKFNCFLFFFNSIKIYLFIRSLQGRQLLVNFVEVVKFGSQHLVMSQVELRFEVLSKLNNFDIA